MPMFGGGYQEPREIHYLFVDGGSLRGRLKNVSRDHFLDKHFILDFAKLVPGFTKVFYYDALFVREEGEEERDYEKRIRPQRELLDSAAAIDGIHVYEGDARRRRKVGHVQKKVDVMIAVDMLTHTFRKNMHKATLLTGDNDFKPLIDALVHEGMFVTLWYPPGETSRELLNAADARRTLSMRVLHDLLTEDSKKDFSLPSVANINPAQEPGNKIKEWMERELQHALYRDGSDHVVTKEGNALNRLHVRHGDLKLLKAFCADSLDIHVPE